MSVFLETGRLVLRRVTEDDADALVALDADPEVRRFLDTGGPVPPEVVRGEVLPRMLAAYERHGGLGWWIAEERTSGAFLGWFELRPLDRPGEAELGYRLARAAWGRGYATEGARAVVDKGFREFGIRRVVATTMTVNTGSRRVLEKTGLRYVRTFFEEWPDPVEGAEHGDVEYALTREEWLHQSEQSRQPN
ncbi:GNAT family N-acetyltransferase [Actinomadura kijaniata]|uniref:GNAT family N-acetyltransferase n=1 Tax=Actinomadura kijaniata TaxID=46161 RepID=UPI00082B7FC5|nr:GNAT family N-acetyltransferase [Actinomadura kijaniata]